MDLSGSLVVANVEKGVQRNFAVVWSSPAILLPNTWLLLCRGKVWLRFAILLSIGLYNRQVLRCISATDMLIIETAKLLGRLNFFQGNLSASCLYFDFLATLSEPDHSRSRRVLHYQSALLGS